MVMPVTRGGERAGRLFRAAFWGRQQDGRGKDHYELVRQGWITGEYGLSAAILSRWATLLPILGDDGWAGGGMLMQTEFFGLYGWQGWNDFTVKTRLMLAGWVVSGTSDAVTGEWSTERDPMHLAPIFCGAPGWGHVEQYGPL